MHSSYKSKGGLSRLFAALGYSLRGLRAAFRYEAAFRQELLLLAILTPVAFWIGRTPLEIMLLVGSLLFVLVVELLNSAVEAVADAVTIDHHPLIGRAKDLASAAVLLSMGVPLLVWIAVICG